ncbi:MAG: arylsulfatase [Kiritimatiellia bacterium]
MNLLRRTVLLTLALTLPTAAAPPNIVLIMPDDVGYGDYSFLGNPVVRTPAVDAFCKQGVRFTDVQVAPTCSPTRSSILTGRHEFRNGVTHTIHERERLTLRATTLAQVLKSAGYTTGIFGKWHLGDEEAYRPENRGFDEVYIHGAGGIGQSYPGSCGDAPGNTNLNPALWHNGQFEKTSGYCTDLFFARAIEWIDEQRAGSKPFFAFITPNAAHSPHVLPEDDYRHLLPKLAGRKDARELAKFLGMIENIDANFGKLLGRIDTWGLAGNTLVIYMASDNGGTDGAALFDAGLRGTKGSPWQGGTRTWACWRWPAGFAGPAECDALTSRVDIFPTLAGIAGAALTDDVRAQVEGRSLLPLLRDPKAAWPDRTLVTHVGRWEPGENPATMKYERCAIRNARFTLVNNRQLFDLSADPGEKTNVIDRHPEVAARLRADYEAWWTSVQPQLVNEAAHRTAPAVNPFKELYERQFGTDRP